MVSELDTGRYAMKEVEPRRGWIGGSHIDWRKERVPVRMLALKESGL